MSSRFTFKDEKGNTSCQCDRGTCSGCNWYETHKELEVKITEVEIEVKSPKRSQSKKKVVE